MRVCATSRETSSQSGIGVRGPRIVAALALVMGTVAIRATPNAWSRWAGVITPNDPDDPPTPTRIAC